jgi:CubicO group peptidase (beta-lactamase class C family)
VTETTLWDLASVTKVVATTSLAMIAASAEEGWLDRLVTEFLPEFGANDKGAITVRHLLRHDAGLPAFRPYHLTCDGPEAVRRAIYAETLKYPTGTKSVYSDLGMITLQWVLERHLGGTLDRLATEQVFGPLNMTEITFRPESGRCAPTEPVEDWRREQRRRRGDATDTNPYVQGEVHDPTAATLDGVAGHAGLFSTMGDLAKFAQAMLANQLAPASLQKAFTARQEAKSTRGLGWDTKSETGSSAGERFGPRSYGHTGFTGTSLWIDPDTRRWAVLLSNRVHPTAENRKILAVRPNFHDAVVEDSPL